MIRTPTPARDGKLPVCGKLPILGLFSSLPRRAFRHLAVPGIVLALAAALLSGGPRCACAETDEVAQLEEQVRAYFALGDVEKLKAALDKLEKASSSENVVVVVYRRMLDLHKPPGKKAQALDFARLDSVTTGSVKPSPPGPAIGVVTVAPPALPGAGVTTRTAPSGRPAPEVRPPSLPRDMAPSVRPVSPPEPLTTSVVEGTPSADAAVAGAEATPALLEGPRTGLKVPLPSAARASGSPRGGPAGPETTRTPFNIVPWAVGAFACVLVFYVLVRVTLRRPAAAGVVGRAAQAAQGPGGPETSRPEIRLDDILVSGRGKPPAAGKAPEETPQGEQDSDGSAPE
ncbi:MAG TPA: hypothetical protein VM492_05315 [Sumerlaeia bacterium]|nr:hypothetical protein [Sumerlaeia bacterium]